MSGESGQKSISTAPESARLALADLYATRLKEREGEGEESGPVFRLKQVEADERPVLIQCCIR
ncbi:hypothetical protein ACGF1Z_00455 [Streptomyces sp. NPDC048018]|uniref:hypothetical protein n=1 Tax=Streptomyces sp. NPDC048018 TaxID=3365499 RepID=UPI00371B32E8